MNPLKMFCSQINDL